MAGQSAWKLHRTSKGHIERIDLLPAIPTAEEAQGDASTPGLLIVGDRLYIIDSDASLHVMCRHLLTMREQQAMVALGNSRCSSFTWRKARPVR